MMMMMMMMKILSKNAEREIYYCKKVVRYGRILPNTRTIVECNAMQCNAMITNNRVITYDDCSCDCCQRMNTYDYEMYVP